MSEFAVKDDLLDAQTLRAASAAIFGGADIVECVQIAQRVTGTDLDSWHDEWRRAGETAYSIGVTAEAAGQTETARLAFLRACTYFRTSGLVLLEAPVDPRLVDSVARQRDAFRRAIAHFRTPVEPIEIPFEGITLPGYHFRAAADGARRATVILVNGYDGTVEESYFFNAQAALDRGYDVVAFDGPGQGSVLVEQGVHLRPDWENVIAPVMDWVLEQPTTDPDRVAIIGLSLGGYLAPRAASGEHRLAACIADSGFYDMFDSAVARIPGPLRSRATEDSGALAGILGSLFESRLRKPTEGWAMRRGLYVNGVDSMTRFLTDARRYTLKGVAERITCPTLVCHAENDDIAASAPDLFAALTVERKQLITFTVAEGAGQHCELGARQLYLARSFGWLDSILDPRRLG
ncbi:alpha/beta fold hydrolase [Cnuibacter physcomitrellae]|uniref:alpha/beta hydrolase family protein n=1 Tax=Cnuibacter physcomitrellae TaxID=1619308 RepID=UPI002176002C|nr:alpha/beta fold hydrolase [Cnuibacter physcomitrellae]MCS5499248.1 alpha/beta fold hydrolase [Cnuibacter physcomitrellae]